MVARATEFNKQRRFQKSIVGLEALARGIAGVETENEATVSLELGADLLPGYFLSGSQEMAGFDDDIPATATRRATDLARKFKGYMVGKINQRKLQHGRFNVILNQLLCELTNAQAGLFNQVLSETISQYPNVECIYILDEGGIQISETVCNATIPRKESGVMFQPAPQLSTAFRQRRAYDVAENILCWKVACGLRADK